MTDKVVYISKNNGTYILRGSKACTVNSFDKLVKSIPRDSKVSTIYGMYPEEIFKLAKKLGNDRILPPLYDI